MSSPLLLKAFVNERLTAAADEIFKFFDKTIATYEEEAFCSQREIKRLRGLLLDLVSNQKSGLLPISFCRCPKESKKRN